MTNRSSLLVLVLAGLAACGATQKSAIQPPLDTASDTTAEPAATEPLGDTMADAVAYERGGTIAAPLLCHTSSYAKLTLTPGESLHFDVTVTSPGEEACVSIGYLKDSGGDAGIADEVCSTESKSYDVTVPEGAASYVQLSENGVCRGASVTITVK